MVCVWRLFKRSAAMSTGNPWWLLKQSPKINEQLREEAFSDR